MKTINKIAQIIVATFPIPCHKNLKYCKTLSKTKN